jgi:ribokinase
MTRVAVVGHTEWVDFVRVAHQPPRGGLAEGERLFEHAGGGAVVAAAVLARLGAEVDFYTALADDERADRALAELRGRGIVVHAARRPGPTRYVFTTLEDGGERTIVTVGARHAPTLADALDLTALRAADGVYATAADAGLLAEAGGGGRGDAGRSGSVVVSTRIGPPNAFTAQTGIDAAVFSASDAGETGALAGWAQVAARLVATEGADGGHWHEGDGRVPDRGRWAAAPLPGPARDSYGCGDSFAAGFTFGLAGGGSVADAVAIGARCGAEMLTRVGAP